MHIGSYISGAGHVGMLGWLFFGMPAPAPVTLDVQSVSTISSAEFEALLAAQRAPEGLTDVAQPALPDVTDDIPDVAPQPDAALVETPPPPPPAPAEDTLDFIDTTPPVDDPPVAPEEPVGAVAVPAPEVAPEAVPAPSERITPDPVAPSDPEALTDPDTQDAVARDAQGETVRETPQQATAPEASAPEIVPERTQAPRASLRPPGRRPPPPTQQVVAQPDLEDADPVVNNDDVMRALTAAQDDPVPAGPPLSSGEKEALRVAVSACWNVGSLSSEALRTTVVVGVSMNQDGTPILGSIQLISSADGSQTAARQAFEAARRAIIRCGARGYDLPKEKYDQWQDIEMTFNPERMRVR